MSNENQQAPVDAEETAQATDQQDAPVAEETAAAGVDAVAGADAGTGDAPATSTATEVVPATEPAPAVEQEPAPVAPATAAVVEAPAPAVVEAPAAPAAVVETAAAPVAPAEQDTLAAHLERMFPDVKEFPLIVTQTAQRMEAYLNVMGPGRAVDEKAGGYHQRDLFNAISSAIAADEGHYNYAIETVLYYFKKHRKDAFSMRLANRFMNTVRLSKEDAKALQVLIHLFMTSCDPVGRSHSLQQIEFSKVVAALPNVRHQEHILAFYKKG